MIENSLTEKYTAEYAKLADNFDCGNIIINNFLKNGNALDENQGITYVLLTSNKDCIIGYYNIETGRVDQVEEIGDQTLFKPMGGTININYLAIDNKFQGIKIEEKEGQNIYLGDLLLNDCEKRIAKLRKEVGIVFITVCSTKQGYHLYHERNSYEDFEDDMNIVVQENEITCFKLYKWVDDIIAK